MKDRIKRLMRERRITQAKLGELVGVSQSTVGGWLNGTSPRVTDAIKLAEALDVSLIYLCLGDDKGHYLSQAEFSLKSLTGEEADRIIQLADVVADGDRDSYESILEELSKIALSITLEKNYCQK